ncbi:MAG: DUF3871 family protein [Flavipsychrobacter sp.]|nr:DUF3871 family protein [Flavipsychrobacter sp.]
MELIQVNTAINNEPLHVKELIQPIVNDIQIGNNTPFIEANTIQVSISELTAEHIIPVFIKDNEPVISHGAMIETVMECVQNVFNGERINVPDIRVSHPIKGRIPEARNKPAGELMEHEKTLYYERMAFVVTVPSIATDIAGNKLLLTIGGVKAYNLDNLYAKSGAEQHFKVFIGFQNTVCTNLCVSTDGYMSNLKVRNLPQLKSAVNSLLSEYKIDKEINTMSSMQGLSISESQFAHFIGRCRMYKYLQPAMKQDIGEMMFGDAQINVVCKDYYNDLSFSRSADGSINLWKLYNLLTGANKGSYIDSFLDRSANAYTIVNELQDSIISSSDNWFLN